LKEGREVPFDPGDDLGDAVDDDADKWNDLLGDDA
jgi:hypothetical protein